MFGYKMPTVSYGFFLANAIFQAVFLIYNYFAGTINEL